MASAMAPIENVKHSTSIFLPFLAYFCIIYRDIPKQSVTNKSSMYVCHFQFYTLPSEMYTNHSNMDFKNKTFNLNLLSSFPGKIVEVVRVTNEVSLFFQFEAMRSKLVSCHK